MKSSCVEQNSKAGIKYFEAASLHFKNKLTGQNNKVAENRMSGLHIGRCCIITQTA